MAQKFLLILVFNKVNNLRRERAEKWKMNEIRLGDVYKVCFDRSIDSRIKAKTWLCAVIKKEATSAIVVPLTANVRNGIKDIDRVYFKGSMSSVGV